MTKSKKHLVPLFERALAKSWVSVAPEVKQHYGLRPRSNDQFSLQGVMTVNYPRLAFPLLAMVRLFGGLPLLREKNIPVEVKNTSRPDSEALYWRRTFTPPDYQQPVSSPVIFHSSMEYAGGHEVIEYMGRRDFFKIGVKMALKEEDGAIHFTSTAYLIKIGRLKLPIPGHPRGHRLYRR